MFRLIGGQEINSRNAKKGGAMYWFIVALKKYAVFEGRSRRAEYWYFILFSSLIGIALGLIEGMVGGVDGIGEDALPNPMESILSTIYSLAILIPSVAVTTRRLHDVDKSGWWQLLHCILFIGSIVILIWMLKPGTTGSNRFGDDPKEDDIGNREPLNISTES